jgi:hypothetical protein
MYVNLPSPAQQPRLKRCKFVIRQIPQITLTESLNTNLRRVAAGGQHA